MISLKYPSSPASPLAPTPQAQEEPSTLTGWQRVVMVDDLDGDGNCPTCQNDFAECGCPGLMQAEEFEYRWDRSGAPWARRRTAQA